jgi:hypothetical protein
MLPEKQQGYTDTSEEISVPYSKVDQAEGLGYQLHPDEAPGYAKDKAHAGEGPAFWERMQSRLSDALKPVPNEKEFSGPLTNTDRSFLRTITSIPGYVKDLALAFKHSTVDHGNPDEFMDLIDPSKVPENMKKQYDADYAIDPKMARQNLAGNILGLVAVGAATHGATEKLSGSEPLDERGSTTPKPSKSVGKLVEDVRKQNFDAEGRELSYQQELRTKAEKIRIDDQAELAKLHEATKKAAEAVRKANEAARNAATEENRNAAWKYLQERRRAFHETEGREVAYKKTVADKAEEIRAEDAKQEAARRAEFEAKRQPVVEHNEAAAKTAEEKEAATTLANSSEPKIKAELKKTEETVNKEANKKYNDIRAKIGEERNPPYQRIGPDGHIQGAPVPRLQHIYDNAVAKITDWTNDPTLIRNLGKRLEGSISEPGDPEGTYGDLQDLRTKVGGALRTGGLPSDVFNAYKGMMEDIDEGMQQVADAHDMGPQQTEARDYYRRYAQAFLDDSSPIRKSIHAGIEAKTGSLFKNFHERDAALEALAEYNSELAGTIKGIAEAQSKAAKTRVPPIETEPAAPQPLLTSGSAEERAAQEVKQPKRVPLPEAPAEIVAEQKPEPAPPQPRLTTGSPEERAAQEVDQPEGPAPGRKINIEDIEGVKGEAYQKGVDAWVNNRGRYLALWPAFGLLRTMLHGSGFPIGEAALESGGTLLATRLVGRALENPRIANFFTKATAKDIASIPPDLRGDFPELVKAAKANGIKVSPALVAAAISSGRPKNQEAKQ